MLFFRLHEYHEFLRPFIEYLNFMPNVVSYDNIQIAAESIVPDEYIVNILKGI